MDIKFEDAFLKALKKHSAIKKQVKKEALKNPGVKKEYDALEPIFELRRKLIRMRKTVGNKLKTLRKQKRLTQKELAARLNIGISQLNKYESGMHMPPIKKLIQLSNIFDITLDYLVKDRETAITELHNNKFIKRFKELDRLLRNYIF